MSYCHNLISMAIWKSTVVMECIFLLKAFFFFYFWMLFTLYSFIVINYLFNEYL